VLAASKKSEKLMEKLVKEFVSKLKNSDKMKAKIYGIN
jgi:hypothetical protein